MRTPRMSFFERSPAPTYWLHNSGRAELLPDQDSSELQWQQFEEFCIEAAEHDEYPVDECPEYWCPDYPENTFIWMERFMERRYPSVWTRWDQEALEGEHGAENMRNATVTLTELGLE